MKQGKHIFIENPEEYFELSEYEIAVQYHIFWHDRYPVVLLMVMEDFLNRKLNGESLCGKIFGLRCKLINKCEKFNLELLSRSEKVKYFQPNVRSKKLSEKLSRIFTSLFCNCDDFDEEYETDEFYNSIKNNFLNFQKTIKKSDIISHSS